MPRLEDLKKSLLDMTPDELRDRIKAIREDRIIRKGKPKAEKKPKAQAKAANLKAALDAMSPEELAALLKEMGE